MKRNLAYLLPLLALGLAGCDHSSSSSVPSASSQEQTSSEQSGESSSSSNPSSDYGELEIPDAPEASEKARTALASLKGANHSAHIETSTDVYRTSALEVGIHQGKIMDLTHQYGDVRAYREEFSYEYWDYQLQDKVESTEWGYSEPVSYYYEDPETGLALVENISLDNEVTTSWLSAYNENSGSYTPYAFDSLFRNPWDYVSSSDIVEEEDGSLHLRGGKAQFLVECYGGTSINYVEDIELVLGDDGGIDELEFTIPDLDDDERYVRVNTMTVTYDRNVGESPLPHLTPYENDNPELAVALSCLEGVDSYTYLKEFFTDSTRETASTWTKGYFVRDDMAFFHQMDTPEDTAPYTGGYDYDYRAVYQEETDDYLVEDYVYRTLGYEWGTVMLSSTQPYIIETFEEIGPSFGDIDPAIFRKTGELTYEAEELIMPSVGHLFDNGMAGAQSGALESTTVECEITLTADKTAIDHVDCAFTVQGSATYLRFTLSDIGTTVIPSFAY